MRLRVGESVNGNSFYKLFQLIAFFGLSSWKNTTFPAVTVI